MFNISKCYAASKFESQISRYRQDTEFEIFGLVNKDLVLLVFTHVLYWYTFQRNVLLLLITYMYEHIESIIWPSTSHFDRKIVTCQLFVNKNKTRALFT